MTRAWVVALALAVVACSRPAALGVVPYFPGAARVGTTSFIGEAHGFPAARWEQVELRTQAPYPQVREFYQRVRVSGWTSTFESEVPKSTGRVFSRYLADGRRRTFYVITVEERARSRDVLILLRRGIAR
ncbi:MAG: hypothetical protein QN174_05450 [Armatimonadota bacterium]|nr:hypothetical protein [Armatimonadota bacterium]MDR7452879.1 hypothetical protein [Armatimonadota bacterium]MDR7456189.1 hypothetical protein [Armatimonadota bacterium]MDR7496385.1 hypothetical protein [Armatimonadota bacterium]MDR7512886.1 hypothetical protein [Armatimonadota bacterium]